MNENRNSDSIKEVASEGIAVLVGAVNQSFDNKVILDKDSEKITYRNKTGIESYMTGSSGVLIFAVALCLLPLVVLAAILYYSWPHRLLRKGILIASAIYIILFAISEFFYEFFNAIFAKEIILAPALIVSVTYFLFFKNKTGFWNFLIKAFFAVLSFLILVSAYVLYDKRISDEKYKFEHKKKILQDRIFDLEKQGWYEPSFGKKCFDLECYNFLNIDSKEKTVIHSPTNSSIVKHLLKAELTIRPVFDEFSRYDKIFINKLSEIFSAYDDKAKKYYLERLNLERPEDKAIVFAYINGCFLNSYTTKNLDRDRTGINKLEIFENHFSYRECPLWQGNFSDFEEAINQNTDIEEFKNQNADIIEKIKKDRVTAYEKHQEKLIQLSSKILSRYSSSLDKDGTVKKPKMNINRIDDYSFLGY